MRQLELIREAKLHTLLPESGKERRLEASGVYAQDDDLFVIFDNASQIGRIDVSLAPHARNAWLGDRAGTAGHEDITYNARQERYYLLIEAALGDGDAFQSEVVEYDRGFRFQERHRLPVAFQHDNKGFEGLTYVQRDGHDYALALCEGNHCRGGREGRQKGHGRIHVFQRTATAWQPVALLALPATARFADHSSIDVRDGRVAVLSQEGAMVWLGALAPDAWRFLDAGAVYRLPAGSRDRPHYCHAEGVAWLAPDQLAIVSDRRARSDPKRCAAKDESVHVFRIP